MTEREIERERLVEIMMNSRTPLISKPIAKTLADDLIANGVIVPPCKVGDTVYVVHDGYVTSAIVLALYIDRDGGMLDLKIKTKDETTIGFKTVIDMDNYTFNDVFLTREEAEKALDENDKGDDGK